MSKPSAEMALHEAKYFGDLVERDGEIYSWRRTLPVCSKATVLTLVERGWLRSLRSKYQITGRGKLVDESDLPDRAPQSPRHPVTPSEDMPDSRHMLINAR